MIRRGIVVVHGVGEQERADQLDTVVEPLVGFLGRALGHGNVHIVARTHRGGDRTASTTIHLTEPDGAPLEEWHVREAWWARSFRPSKKETALGWALRAFFAHLSSTWNNIILHNLNRLRRRPLPQAPGVWRIPAAGGVFHALDALAWLAITLGYVAIYAVGLVLLLPVYLFLLLPLELVWPGGAERARRTLLNLVTGNIGDQHAMTNRYVAIAAAANAVSTALYPFLDREYLRKNDLAFDTVTVIAHSGGAVVSYEALAGEEVRRWLAEGERGRRITWVTVGSGLNLAWRMRAPHKDRDRAFWGRRIDGHVNWIDIYARYDPVPQGEPPGDLVATLMGEEPRPFVSLRAANADWPFSDHGGYWHNREESMARIVHAIADSRLGNERLDPKDGAAPHALGPAVERAVADGPRHRQRVTVAQAIRLTLATLIAGFLILRRDTVERLGAWLLGERASFNGWTWLPAGARTWLGDLVPRSLLGIDLSGVRAWLVGAATILLVLLLIAILVRPFLEFRRWLRVERDDVRPAPVGRG